MTYDETDGAMVTLAQAIAECSQHSADAIDAGDILSVYDRNNGDHWGDVPIIAGRVSARRVLNVLGY